MMLCFFFKQKTAYEMRISDWSSDVCSSDLLTVSTIGILRLLGLRDHRGSIITHEEVETVLAEGTRAGLMEPAEQAMIGEVLQLGDRPVRAAKIGRASCRERVCQYV